MRISKQDVQLALRSFARRPRFTLVAVLSLSLAMALNTTMYSVIDALVNPRYALRSPERLYHVVMWGDLRHRVDGKTRGELLRAGFRTYEAVSYASMERGRAAIEHDRRFTLSEVGIAAPNYFSMLGAHPLAGRLFADGDYRAGTSPVIITDRMAGTLFPEGEAPVGARVDIDGVAHPVIGVIGPGSMVPMSQHDVWVLPDPGTLENLVPNIVRLRDDATLSDAQHEMSVLAARFAMLAGDPAQNASIQLKAAIAGQFSFRAFHYALIGAVAGVLLIACANLANLQLARGIGRARELALRAALGASRADLVVHLFLESALLSLAGLCLGLLLTFWGMHLMKHRIPPTVSEYIVAPQVSWHVFAFAAGVCVVCSVIVGLVPAIRISRVDPNELLKSGAGTGAYRIHRRQYGIMVIAEVALTLAIVSATSLIVRKAAYYQAVPLGYDVKPLSGALLRVEASHDSTVSMYALGEALVGRIRPLRGVADAAVFFYSGYARNAITVANADGSLREISNPMGSFKKVMPSFLRTKGVEIEEGRDFTEGEPPEPEVIIDRPTARKLFPNRRAVGELVKFGAIDSNRPWVRIVGIARPTADYRASSAWWLGPVSTDAYIGDIYSRLSSRDSMTIQTRGGIIQVLVRSRGVDPASMPVTLRRALASSPPFHLWDATSEEAAVGILRQRERHDFVAATFIAFSMLATGLAALGIYSIVAHTVAERRRELGVRLALGASVRDILRVVLREGNVIVLAGIALGIFCAWKTEWWLRAFTFEDDVLDAPLFAIAAMLMFVIALVTALVPALRATRIDPVESLRHE